MIFSVFAGVISLNFRIGKFLNLALYSAFSLGAYLLFFFGEFSVLLAPVFGLCLSVGTILLKRSLCKSVMDATIVSLGVGIAVEELLRIFLQKGYYYIVTENANFLLPTFAAFYAIVYAAYMSPFGIKLKFLEEDEELAKICGVNVELYAFVSTFLAFTFSILLGISASNNAAIHPQIGLSYMLAGIIVAAFSTITKSIGEKNYLSILSFSLLFSIILGVIW